MSPTFQNMHEHILAEFQFQQPFESLKAYLYSFSNKWKISSKNHNLFKKVPRSPEVNEEKKMDQTQNRKYLTQEL